MFPPSRDGDVLDGKYKILRKLGEGGMGAVYAGEHVRLGKPIAIKVLHAGASAHNETATRFEREAQAASRIGSDHIVEVFDIGTTPSGERFMVMEYLDGEPLRTRIRRLRRLRPVDLAPLAIQLLQGLHAAHAAGIIHRDLKPDNIFIVREKAGRKDFVKILDFGISKFAQVGADSGAATRTGTIMGSPNYMSPEHVQASSEVDARSDLYSVGIILFEAVTGKIPRKGGTFAELLFKVVYEPVPDPRTVEPDLDEAFAAIVMKACAQRREDRYQSAPELIAALEAYLASAPALAQLGSSTIALDAQGAPAPAGSSPGSTSQPSWRNASWPSANGPLPGAVAAAPSNPGAGSVSQRGVPSPGFAPGAQAGAPPQPFSDSQPSGRDFTPGSGSQPGFASASRPGFFPPGGGSGSQPNFASTSQPSFGSPFSLTHGAVDAPRRSARSSGLLVIGVAALGAAVSALVYVAFFTPTGSEAPVAAAAGPASATETASATSAPSAAPSTTAEADPLATSDAAASASAAASTAGRLVPMQVKPGIAPKRPPPAGSVPKPPPTATAATVPSAGY
jgi:serine/threonine-protein kinase